MSLEAEKSARLVRAILANIDMWIDEAAEIADDPEPRRRALHHQRNLMQARRALRAIAGEETLTEAQHTTPIDKWGTGHDQA